MIKRLAIDLAFGLFFLALSISVPPGVLAANESPTRSQGQIDVTVLHVDKYGVYVPGLVFYWDSTLTKQKLDGLTRAAEQLRNKKATITYSAAGGELSKDKRPLLMDIVALKEDSRPAPARDATPPIESSSNGALSAERAQASQSGTHPPPPAARDEEEADEEEPPSHLYSSYREEKHSLPSSRSASITREEVSSFIQRVLRLNESKDVNSVMDCYADQVNYYDRGVVDKGYIKRDMGYYFKNWSSISATLDGDVVLIVTDQPDVRIAKFVSRYSVENSRKSITGRVENVWWVQRMGDGLRIIDQKQKILKSETMPRQ